MIPYLGIFQRFPGICHFRGIFSSKVFAGQCSMHEVISVTVAHDNQVQQLHNNVYESSYVYLLDPYPLKFFKISSKIEFFRYSGFNNLEFVPKDVVDNCICYY